MEEENASQDRNEQVLMKSMDSQQGGLSQRMWSGLVILGTRLKEAGRRRHFEMYRRCNLCGITDSQ